MFVMRYHSEECGGLDIDDFLRAVQAEGIPLSRGYTATMAQQPALQRIAEKHPDYLRQLLTPVSDAATKNMLFLPHNIFLGSESDMKELAAAFVKVQMNYAPDGVKKRRQVTQQVAIQAPTPAVQISAPAVATVAKPVRVGIVGVGVMGQEHASVVAANSALKLTAVADAQQKNARTVAAQFGCRSFETADELINSGEVDAVVIATPHWQHGDLAIAALRAGLHVVCEKPLTVTVEQADEVLRVAAESSGMFAVVHQKRFEPAYMYAKRLLDSGELGPIYRCSMIESAWRSEAYYRSSPWRGTWKGEGGGVLLNQAPHILDRYAWLCGMPEMITARCDTSLHEIEVEDTASAILRHANGAHGFIHISTIEAPAIARTVISCDRGRIAIENGKLFVTKLRRSIREQTTNDTELMGNLESDTREIHLPPPDNALAVFYADFASAVNGDAQLTCRGEEGRDAVELANAIVLSSVRGASVNLPLKRGEYAQFMEEMTSRELQTV
jgi:predicted dehydrogenase